MMNSSWQRKIQNHLNYQKGKESLIKTNYDKNNILYDGDEFLNQNTNNYIEQKQNMDDYHAPSPYLHHQEIIRATKITVRSAANTPMIGLKHQFTNAAYYLNHNTRSNLQQYEQQWEHNILNQMVREMQDNGMRSQKKILRYQAEHHQQDYLHNKHVNATNRNKKKQQSKYKAYAVKMKIPQQHQQLLKPKIRQNQSRVGSNSDSKNKSQNRLWNSRNMNYQKAQDIFRVNVREIAMLNIFESNATNIFKKKPPRASKHNNIRKRSIKNSQKKKQFEQAQTRQSNNKFLKTSTSPKLANKFVMSLDQSTFQHNQHVQNSVENILASNKISKQKQVQKKLLTKSIKSPQKLNQKDQRVALTRNREFTMKVQQDDTFKFIQKIDKAIHFKKKQTKPESPVKEIKKQAQPQSIDKNLIKSNLNLQVGQTSKTLVKALYTSKDVIRNKNNALKQSGSKDLDVSRREGGNRKVFVFNSEDQYVRRLLIRAGWIQNHDNRSQFYNIKWVFKPDSIDYHSLKPNQIVNHVQNSHELTAKNYLNKNLKSHISQWTSLNSFYPRSYDLGRSCQKQDFYEQYKKQVMMILMQNLYDYFIQMRTSYVQQLTVFYMSILNDDGTYQSDSKSYSQLRSNSFRKIDMEDYKNYDSEFLVHMNLFIISNKYWRSIRKQEDFQFDQQAHFLSFKLKEFDNHFHYLERYSKMTLPFNHSQLQPYFQMEYFATPSQTAIERFVKQYVYFEHQLKREWRIFGKNNIWIVKPSSASRGNGIYLANDCSQVLTDNRGIQSKIVQRYIERPLILNSGLVGGKKFDLRQWVLLRSVQPLQIYMFSHCYVRICSQDFNISNINNLKAHLTNYSFNKKHYKRASQSVIDQDTFQQMLLKQKNINFVEQVRPKIKQIIVNSIKSTQHLISDCNQRCFSLLGYDILLDEDSQPWLLEINMSPACEQRTQWLRSYLQAMGKQLLTIIQPDYQPIISNPIHVESSSQWDKQPFSLKKMRTQVSHKSEDIQPSSSYVNAVFSLDANKEPVNPTIQEHQSINSQEQDELRVNQEGQLVQNDIEIIQEWQKMEIQQDCDSDENQEIGEKEEDKQRIKTQKFNNLQIYLEEEKNIEEQEKNIEESPTKNEPLIIQQSKDLLSFQSKQSQGSCIQIIENTLKWQKIYHEEYASIKKDGDLQMEILGTKIHPQKIDEIDQYINYIHFQETMVQNKCINIQKYIRKFLLHKKQQKKVVKEMQSLKINVSKLMSIDSEREAKSALQNRQFHLSIREINATKQTLQRPITARTNSASSRQRNQSNFRQRIRSIVCKAAARMNKQDQKSTSKDSPIEQQIISNQIMAQQEIPNSQPLSN